MHCGIICGRITPARGNLEHRPLSGAVFTDKQIQGSLQAKCEDMALSLFSSQYRCKNWGSITFHFSLVTVRWWWWWCWSWPAPCTWARDAAVTSVANYWAIKFILNQNNYHADLIIIMQLPNSHHTIKIRQHQSAHLHNVASVDIVDM